MAGIDTHHNNIGLNAFNTQRINPFVFKRTFGNIIDLFSYESSLFVVQSGVLITGTFTLEIYDGNESDMFDIELVDSKFLLSNGDFVFSSAEDNVIKTFGYVGKKRYIQLAIATPSGTNGIIGSSIILGNALHNPTQGAIVPTG